MDRPKTRTRLYALVLFVLGSAAPAAAATGTEAAGYRSIVIEAPSPAVGPKIVGAVDTASRFRIESAYQLALQRFHDEPACRDLFAQLGHRGSRALSQTVYRLASSEDELRVCRQRRAAAFTQVGGRTTWICPQSFLRLNRQRAAMYLIHEALHHAGLGEAPADPAAPTSGEINVLVRRHCRL
jgi:hypothetical protein